MAVTVTELAGAIRIGDGVTDLPQPELGIVSRLLGVGTALVQLEAPDAPEAVQDLSLIHI